MSNEIAWAICDKQQNDLILVWTTLRVSLSQEVPDHFANKRYCTFNFSVLLLILSLATRSCTPDVFQPRQLLSSSHNHLLSIRRSEKYAVLVACSQVSLLAKILRLGARAELFQSNGHHFVILYVSVRNFGQNLENLRC